MSQTENPTVIEQKWTLTTAAPVIDFMAAQTGLSKSRLKDAMNKGAVWLKRGRQEKCLRRVQTDLQPGDQLSLHYDSAVLAAAPPPPRLVYDARAYTVWDKAPGMLSQGTHFGDHAALPRWIEQQFSGRPCWLVHRLDREASGLIVIAHRSEVAGELSQLFSGREVSKSYRVEVAGTLPAEDDWITLNLPLDGKPAETRYRVLRREERGGVLEVDILTGRKHQIRRHLSMVGLPVLGDPRYGSDNQDSRGLRLRAVRLAFQCPVTHQQKVWQVPDEWAANQS